MPPGDCVAKLDKSLESRDVAYGIEYRLSNDLEASNRLRGRQAI